MYTQNAHTHTYIHTYIHMCTYIFTETDKDRQADRQPSRQTGRQTDRETDRQTDSTTCRHADMQTDRHTCIHTCTESCRKMNPDETSSLHKTNFGLKDIFNSYIIRVSDYSTQPPGPRQGFGVHMPAPKHLVMQQSSSEAPALKQQLGPNPKARTLRLSPIRPRHAWHSSGRC